MTDYCCGLANCPDLGIATDDRASRVITSEQNGIISDYSGVGLGPFVFENVLVSPS
jgi:hypothetical protein